MPLRYENARFSVVIFLIFDAVKRHARSLLQRKGSNCKRNADNNIDHKNYYHNDSEQPETTTTTATASQEHGVLTAIT